MSRTFPMRHKLAAALRELAGIPYKDAKAMHVSQIISLFEFDHDPIPHAHGGPSLHFNCMPRLRAGHRLKTAKIDIPMIAKVKRVSKAEQEFRQRILAKGVPVFPSGAAAVVLKPKRKIPSRPFPKGQRKMRGKR
jgi:hypothetical protein